MDEVEAYLEAMSAQYAEGGPQPDVIVQEPLIATEAHPVIYYGLVDEYEPEVLRQLDMPVLGLFGADDPTISVAEVEAFEQTLREAGKEVEVEVYEGAGHAFANPVVPNYNEAAAEAAWDRMERFLTRHLLEIPPEQALPVGPMRHPAGLGGQGLTERLDHEDGAVRTPHDFLGDTAQQEPFQPAASVGGQHNQVRFLLLGEVEDGARRPAVA